MPNTTQDKKIVTTRMTTYTFFGVSRDGKLKQTSLSSLQGVFFASENEYPQKLPSQRTCLFTYFLVSIRPSAAYMIWPHGSQVAERHAFWWIATFFWRVTSLKTIMTLENPHFQEGIHLPSRWIFLPVMLVFWWGSPTSQWLITWLRSVIRKPYKRGSDYSMPSKTPS